jgi:hypothetical protein
MFMRFSPEAEPALPTMMGVLLADGCSALPHALADIAIEATHAIAECWSHLCIVFSLGLAFIIERNMSPSPQPLARNRSIGNSKG